MKQKKLLMAVMLTAAAALSGCNTTPTKNSNLEQARANYSTAQSDPQVIKLAALEFKQAGDALNQADAAWRDKEKPEKVNHLAYIANQKVAIAQETAKLKTAEETMQSGDAERNRVLLAARTAEADLAKQKAKQLEDELNAKNSDRGLTITLGDVLFDTAKAHLKSGGMRTLEKLATFLKENPERKVLVEGFTDSRGSDEYNQGLSERRANAVRTALIGLGVSTDRIEARGYGEAFPVAGNEDAAGQQLNRRVEIIVSKDNQAIPPRS
jgi:outer membrane protein OmpA-like peptidoglycan-associated protein